MYNGALPFFAGLTIEQEEIDWEQVFKNEKVRFELDGFNTGLPFAIFRDNGYTFEFMDLVDGYFIGNWNGYENCVCLQNTIGL